MFRTVLQILSGILTVYGLYYAILGMFAFAKGKKANDKVKKNYKFSIIIAARNEEAVIGNLIDSLQKQNYDKKLYDINVIVNNSTDNTYKVSKKYGVNTIKCEIPVKSKGEVLRYTFRKFKNHDNDAYIIFDADNVVHPDFLKEMNLSLNNGYRVAQGFRDSKNYQDNWISGGYALFYYIQNFFFSLSRKKLKASASINGTGFMVKKDFIEHLDFNPISLTEDIELTIMCAIQNEKIDFVKKAITYDEHPTDFKVSLKQRLRWSVGNIQCWKKYHRELIKSFFKYHNLASVDMYLNNIAAYIQVLSFVVVVAGYIEKLLSSGTLVSFIGIVGTVGSFLGTFAVSLFVVLYNKKNVLGIMSGLILFSLFMLSWIPVNIVSIFKKDIKWVHIGHNRSVKIDEVIETN